MDAAKFANFTASFIFFFSDSATANAPLKTSPAALYPRRLLCWSESNRIHRFDITMLLLYLSDNNSFNALG
jgi:hypothetical protein